MSLVAVTVLMMAAWRITNLFGFEEGPFKIFQRFRYLIGVTEDGENFTSELFRCIYCLSVWGAGITLLMFYFLPFFVLLLFAVSAGVILLEKVSE